MAVTKGHGNPKWSWDEVVLALDLYFDCNGTIPNGSDARVQELSTVLRSFPQHDHATRKESFRNPDSVVFKLQNIRQVATGKGLANTSRVDREVWDALGDEPARTKEFAQTIRAGVALAEKLGDEEEEETFQEGRVLTDIHRRRERSRRIRKKVLENRIARGKLVCEICGLSGMELDADMRDALFECHHVVPLGAAVEVNTKLEDMALLCANCHRLLHRAMVIRGEWLSIDAAKTIIYASSAEIDES